MNKPTERFSETVADYVKYRPSYPPEVLQTLITECGLTRKKIIADIGSGTGFLAKLFLDYGNTVYGVEPNQPMREVAEDYLQSYANFHSINGSAEATTLRDNSIDIITVGTAFHWFDVVKTKNEFKRILRTPGFAFIVWNVRNIDESPLVRDYENLILKFGKDYKNTAAQKFNKVVVADFFSPFAMYTRTFKNIQQLDWEGFKGRLLSSSFSPRPNDLTYNDMVHELKTIFNHYQQNGVIDFLYLTKAYYGQLH